MCCLTLVRAAGMGCAASDRHDWLARDGRHEGLSKRKPGQARSLNDFLLGSMCSILWRWRTSAPCGALPMRPLCGFRVLLRATDQRTLQGVFSNPARRANRHSKWRAWQLSVTDCAAFWLQKGFVEHLSTCPRAVLEGLELNRAHDWHAEYLTGLGAFHFEVPGPDLSC